MLNVQVQLEVATAVRPSPRVLQTAAMFGLGVDEQRVLAIVPPTDVPLPSGGVVFVTGPSGGGKSTMLALIAQQARAKQRRVLDLDEVPQPPDLPLVDCFDRPLRETMELLSIVGLGDAFVMLRRPRELSDGQRARLRIAQAIELARAGLVQVHHGEHGDLGEDADESTETMHPMVLTEKKQDTVTANPHSPAFLRDLRVLRGESSCEMEAGEIIIADEFAATLDRLTAGNLAASLRRWVSRTRHCLVLATSHDDLLEPLEPDVLIVKGLGEQVEVHQRSKSRQVDKSKFAMRPGEDRISHDAPTVGPFDLSTFRLFDLSLLPATLRDYQSLARFHYRAGRPGVVTSGFKLVHRAATVVGGYLQRRDETQIVAVLLRSLPHLGCALRDLAVRERYRRLGQREAAMLLNREVRNISRVVVDPRFRGLGLSVALVRHALDNPEPGTMLTEALATMGQVHPFFEKAGMTRYERPPLAAHARLRDALEQLGIAVETLASLEAMHGATGQLDESRRGWLEHELRRFAQATRGRSGGSRRTGDLATIDDLIRHARERLLNQPVYYAFVHQRSGAEECLEAPAPGRSGVPTAGKPAR